jgi:hypothetical protein
VYNLFYTWAMLIMLAFRSFTEKQPNRRDCTELGKR